ncbi:MAG: hypothetical protein E6J14_15290 [Chloroflexi bacterium]|nr:MAG: hypothetical protein E6J14_15290 [Chloroflexota bacterium]
MVPVVLDEAFNTWWSFQSEALQNTLAACLEILEEDWPDVPWPLVVPVPQSRHAAMYALQPAFSGVRCAFAHEANAQRLVVLLADDSRNERQWAEVTITSADDLYDEWRTTQGLP